MKEQVKKLVLGTPLEPLARKVHSLFRRRGGTGAPPDIRNQTYDAQTVEVMRRVLAADSNCIDVGCHEGSVLEEILGFAPRGTHFAFEPLPDLYRNLVESFRGRGDVRFFDVALSDTAGTATFQHVVSNPAYSGLRVRRYDRPNEVLNQITVKTELLDRIVPKDVPIRFVKIDVEGGELGVFKGGVETILRDRPVIVFEHGPGAAEYYGAGPGDVHDLLVGRCGLRLFVMADWLGDPNSGGMSRAAFGDQFFRDYYFMAHP